MSTGYGWEGIRQVCATLLGARHAPERLCGGSVYLGRYNKCPTFYLFTEFSLTKVFVMYITNQNNTRHSKACNWLLKDDWRC